MARIGKALPGIDWHDQVREQYGISMTRYETAMTRYVAGLT